MHRAVESFARIQAIIAALARWRHEVFAEIFQQRRAPAFARLRVGDHRTQLLVRDPLLVLAFLLDKTPLLHHVACAEQQQTITRQSVAARAPGFLIVTLDVLGQIVMHHKAHIRLVDAHPERDRRRDHARIIAQKLLLMFRPLVAFQAGVVWLRFKSVGFQFSGQ